MFHRLVLPILALLLFSTSTSSALAQGRRPPSPAPAVAGGTLVLDTYGFWRIHHTLRPPVFQNGQPALLPQKWLNLETAPAEANWKGPDFDDSGWFRFTAPTICRTPYLARLCLRGKFMVSDAGRVKGLALTLKYAGGVAVYLNGKEVALDHAALGKAGEMEYSEKAAASPSPLTTIGIPTNLLRNGLNVLAVEVVRPPFAGEASKDGPYKLSSDTCAINQVQLTAPSADGLAPNASRPSGLQAWNASILATDTDMDCGDQTEPLRPVFLVGGRGGVYSGKVVLGAPGKIEDLKATPGELKSSAGTIPASAVLVRYALPWGRDDVLSSRGVASFPGRVNPLCALSEVPPSASVIPVWITVHVPSGAKPGRYTGTVKLDARGAPAVAAQVDLKVLDWIVPAPQDYRTWVETIESPDTLSVEYKEPMWSQKHFDLMARSLKQCGEIGSRVLYVPLIAHTNLGNEESMVRWIKKGDKYEHDFTAMEKYLDVATKEMGPPKIIVLQVWDLYMSSRQSAGKRFGEGLAGSGMQFDRGPQVTVEDAPGGKGTLTSLPRLADPASKPLWTALIAGVRERLKKRNLDKTIMWGMFTDATPTKEDIQFFQAIAPDVPWVQQGHGLYELGQKVQTIGVLGYQASVWGMKFCDSVPTHGTTDTKDLHGWRNKLLAADFERNTDLDSYPGTRWREFAETCVTGNLRGVGRVGADYWRCVQDKQGRRAGFVHDRFPEGAWGIGGIYLNLCNPVLAPAPQGPVATRNFENFREGIQECEARIYIETSLLDPGLKGRLGADLARRCEDTLDDRISFMYKGLSNMQLIGDRWGDARLWRWTPGVPGHVCFLSGWQERSEKLYSLAAEVAAKH